MLKRILFFLLICSYSTSHGQTNNPTETFSLREMRTILDSFDRQQAREFLATKNYTMHSRNMDKDVYKDTVSGREILISHANNKIISVELRTRHKMDYESQLNYVETYFSATSSTIYKGVFTNSFISDNYYLRLMKFPEEGITTYIIHLLNRKVSRGEILIN